MTVTYRGAGAVAEANNDNVAPALFESPGAGDLLVCVVFWRVATTETVTITGWTQLAHVSAAARLIDVWYKVAAGGESGPTVTISAGGSAGNVIAAICLSFRPTAQSSWSPGTNGTAYTATSGEDVGPITVATGATQANGFVLFAGLRISGDATTVAALSGDSLTWTRFIDHHTLTGSDMSCVGSFGIWSSAPTLSNKTFDFTDGTNNTRAGISVLFNEVLTSGFAGGLSRYAGIGAWYPVR